MADSKTWFRRMREMLEEFDNQPTSTEVRVDGVSYYSDWGYGIECIEFFIEALERRYGGESSANGPQAIPS